MISFAEQLNELDTDQVTATSHVLDMKNVMREDVSKLGLPIEEVVKNAQIVKTGIFVYQLSSTKEGKVCRCSNKRFQNFINVYIIKK